jgi:hypothetical protein
MAGGVHDADIVLGSGEALIGKRFPKPQRLVVLA